MTAAVLDRLTTGYREQAQAYERILELARRGTQLAQAGSPLTDLHSLNLEKRTWLDRIESFESSMAIDKQSWHQGPKGPADARELEQLMTRIADLIEAILYQEREIDRWIFQAVDSEPVVLEEA